jgi:hypothetical protein
MSNNNYERAEKYWSDVANDQPIEYNTDEWVQPIEYNKKSWDSFFDQVPPLEDDVQEAEKGCEAEQDFRFNPNLYRFNEGQLLNELQEYVNSTYRAHYSQNKFQATEFIIDCGHGEGFALGNVLKYVQRYGKKSGYNRADLMKVLHYALIALHNHDLNNEESP